MQRTIHYVAATKKSPFLVAALVVIVVQIVAMFWMARYDADLLKQQQDTITTLQSSLNSDIVTLQKEKAALENTLAERTDEVRRLQAAAMEGKQTLAKRDAAIKERDAMIEQRDADIQDREAKIAVQNQQLADLQAGISRRDKEIGGLQAQIAQLSESMNAYTAWFKSCEVTLNLLADYRNYSCPVAGEPRP